MNEQMNEWWLFSYSPILYHNEMKQFSATYNMNMGKPHQSLFSKKKPGEKQSACPMIPWYYVHQVKNRQNSM